MNALLETFGGIGLFLFGMTAMTSGLSKIAGDRMRSWLARWTRTPFSGAVVGTCATAVLQSSSAMTVAAVGFVAAGLMTFSQAIGIIFGANIGTTLTGWMVALVGFNLKLSTIALPLMFIASLCYLSKPGHALRGFGKTLAGFCLIFMGLSFLQSGLAEFRGAIDLTEWRAENFGGRLLLVLAGVIITLITQSSSATVVAALTALNASMLTLPQAAAVIIGADIGTTSSAALATIGGSTAARRTGFAHVIYNVLTGVMAFLILPLYLWGISRFAPGLAGGSPEVVAVGFHSFFNILGVVIALPFAGQFARLISFMIPEKRHALSIPFEKSVLQDPSAATAALTGGVRSLARAALLNAASAIQGGNAKAAERPAIRSAIDEGRAFAVKVGTAGGNQDGTGSERVFSCLHLLDHVERLCDRALDTGCIRAAKDHDKLKSDTARSTRLLLDLADHLHDGGKPQVLAALETAATELETDKSQFRKHLIASAAAGALEVGTMDAALDAHRWLRRITCHAWRIASYAEKAETPSSSATDAA